MALAIAEHHGDDAGEGERERGDEDGVAAHRPGSDDAPVSARVGRRLLGAAANEVIPLVVGHGWLLRVSASSRRERAQSLAGIGRRAAT